MEILDDRFERAGVHRVHDSSADGRPHAGVTCDGGHLVRARVNTMTIIPTDDRTGEDDSRYIYGTVFCRYLFLFSAVKKEIRCRTTTSPCVYRADGAPITVTTATSSATTAPGTTTMYRTAVPTGRAVRVDDGNAFDDGTGGGGGGRERRTRRRRTNARD